MRLSSDGIPFILPPAMAAAGLLAVGLPLAAAVAALAAVLITAFFRDPDRDCPAPEDRVASPADGKVVVVERQDDGRLRIAVFLSLLDVHVARSPMAARLVRMRRIPGPYAAAFREDAANNARVQMDLETEWGPAELSLMAGLVARRVLPWIAPPAELRRGQRIAIIRFGSRAELLLPRGFQATVESGQTVRAGETVLARPAAAKENR